MSLTDIISIVSKAAPLLGGVLAGPPGVIASMALSLIAKCFGADETNSADIVAKIQADPDAAIKLKQIEEQHFKDQVTDNQSVRDFDESDSLNPMVPFLIIILFSAIGGIIFCLIEFQIATDIKTILVMIITALIREIPDIYKTFFVQTNDDNGSSAK